MVRAHLTAETDGTTDSIGSKHICYNLHCSRWTGSRLMRRETRRTRVRSHYSAVERALAHRRSVTRRPAPINRTFSLFPRLTDIALFPQEEGMD